MKSMKSSQKVMSKPKMCKIEENVQIHVQEIHSIYGESTGTQKNLGAWWLASSGDP